MEMLSMTHLCALLFPAVAWAAPNEQVCQLRSSQTMDQSAALQSCIDAALDFSTLTIEGPTAQAPWVALASTVKINGRTGLAIECPGAGHRLGPGFIWIGAQGGTMVNASGSAGLRIFEHCSFWPQGRASIVFDVDISASVGSTVTTTDDDFNDIGISNQANDPAFIGYRFSQSGDENVEAMRITNNTIYCSGGPDYLGAAGIGIRVSGVTFDALKHRYSDNKINFCAEAIHAANGLPDIGSNAFQSNGVCVSADLTPIRVHDNDSENCGQFFAGGSGGGTAAAIIESNRIAACHPVAPLGCINVHGALISRGNSFDSLGGSQIPVNATFSGTYLLSEGDAIPNPALFAAALQDGIHGFYHSEVKLQGQGPLYYTLQGGNSIVFRCDNSAIPWKVPYMVFLCADAYDGLLKVWEINGPSKTVQVQ